MKYFREHRKDGLRREQGKEGAEAGEDYRNNGGGNHAGRRSHLTPNVVHFVCLYFEGHAATAASVGRERNAAVAACPNLSWSEQ